jgi:hypothetical protein
MIGHVFRAITGTSPLQKTLRRHFGRVPLGQIATAARDFPVTSRVDLQAALEEMFRSHPETKLLGIFSPNFHESPTLAQVFAGGPFMMNIGPLQHDDIDIGERLPVRCLRNGLWLARHSGVPFAILLAQSMRFGMSGDVHVEVAVPSGESGLALSQDLFTDLERRVGRGRTYRGRIISLERMQDPTGRGGAIKVHHLPAVKRDDVILPERTLEVLDRNVGQFVAARDRIKALGFSGRKGLLFYGPPGTGKTYTIHYLASQLSEHTTLLITSEQVMFISEYFRLARFLEPALLIVEDVDLIARERTHMHGPGEEMLLNKLLNEMDGLREDADVMVILTTNRPDQLEPALASRPGRIDQAIEFPLPDEDGRAKLVGLYARNVEVSSPLVDVIVRRTQGVSAAFIKELMRRAAQFQIESGPGAVLQERSVDRALEDMVFAGGSLNLKLLGGATTAFDLDRAASTRITVRT